MLWSRASFPSHSFRARLPGYKGGVKGTDIERLRLWKKLGSSSSKAVSPSPHIKGTLQVCRMQRSWPFLPASVDWLVPPPPQFFFFPVPAKQLSLGSLPSFLLLQQSATCLHHFSCRPSHLQDTVFSVLH